MLRVLFFFHFYILNTTLLSFSQQPNVSLEPISTNLDSPTSVAIAGDGSGRIFITEQDGRILIYDGTQIVNTPFLDIRHKVSCCNERGLLGLAFHTNFVSNGFFYINYTDLAGDTFVARYQVSNNPDIANPDSEQIVITYDQPASNHNGGHLAFGLDNFLYISSGDGGGDPGNRAQEQDNLLGKILRINVDGDDFPNDQLRNYSIPNDNPFGNETWVLGLRNPWRFSFDTEGNMFIGDVGQNTIEEIDFKPFNSSGGENYGWQCFEGSLVFDDNTQTCVQNGGFIFPIVEYMHNPDGNCSVTGGFRYRGSEIPELIDDYVYADFCSGRIWNAWEVSSGNWDPDILLDTSLSISSFGEDENGELYVLDNPFSGSGGFYRLMNDEMVVEEENMDEVLPDGVDQETEDDPNIDNQDDEGNENDNTVTDDAEDSSNGSNDTEQGSISLSSESSGCSITKRESGNGLNINFLLFLLVPVFVSFRFLILKS